jgi:hypothetical protein
MDDLIPPHSILRLSQPVAVVDSTVDDMRRSFMVMWAPQAAEIMNYCTTFWRSSKLNDWKLT